MAGKKVHFNEKVEVKYIVTWAFAHRQARKGAWLQYAIDRIHFQRRIMNVEKILEPVLFQKYTLYKTITEIISIKHHV